MAQCDGQANRQGWGAHRANAAAVGGGEDAERQLEGQNHFHHNGLARSCVVVELQGKGVLGALPSGSMARDLGGWAFGLQGHLEPEHLEAKPCHIREVNC